MQDKNKKRYKIKVNNDFLYFDDKNVTGKYILEKSNNTPVECFSIYQKLKNCDFEKIDLDEKVDLSQNGIERFVVKEPEVFHYFVDDEPETTDNKELTPSQILECAGIIPVEDFYLVQILPDGSQLSYQNEANKPIKMKCPAMRFISIYVGETVVA